MGAITEPQIIEALCGLLSLSKIFPSMYVESFDKAAQYVHDEGLVVHITDTDGDVSVFYLTVQRDERRSHERT